MLKHKLVMKKALCKFESSATPEEAYKRAQPAVMSFWEKIGVVVYWRPLKVERNEVEMEALIMVLE